jgi:hypothetical protein
MCTYTIFIYAYFLTFKSVGWDVKWCPVSRITTPWHAKDRFPDVRKRVGSLGAVRETHTFKTKHYILIYPRNMTEILLKRRKTPNQSINLA